MQQIHTINAATIYAAALAAAAIAPEYNPRDELHSVLCYSARFADVHLATAWDVACIERRQADGREVLSTAAQDAHNWARAQALQETAGDYWHAAGELPPTFVTIQTSERGRMKVCNTRERLQGFAAQVKANQKAFGGGIKPTKRTTPAPVITWPATALKVAREYLQDNQPADALRLASDKLGALFYDHSGTAGGRVFMLMAPQDVPELAGLQSAMRDDGRWLVFDPVSGLKMPSSEAGTRANAVRLATAEAGQLGAEKLAQALATAKAKAIAQDVARAAWCKAHQLADIDQVQEHAAQVPDVAESVAAVVATAAALAQMVQPAAQVAQEQASTAAPVAAMADTCSGADGASMGHAAGLAGHQATSTDTGRPAGPPAAQVAQVAQEQASPAAQCPGVQDLDDTPAKCDQAQDLQPPATISPAALAAAIPVSLARGAFNGVSFSPERRGDRARDDFGQTMAADYAEFHAHAVKGGTLDKLAAEFARYSGRMAGLYRAWLGSSSRCVSWFIAGPSNFPAARMNKRADLAHRRLSDYLDSRELARRAVVRNLRPDLRPIMAGDADAAERLALELAQAERWHATMTAANAAIRKHTKAGEAHQVAALLELGISEASALELLHPKLHYHRPGFQPYELTNHGANVRRIRARLELIERNKAKPVAELAGRDGIRLEDDPPANRVRLYFPEKPDAATRGTLKGAGFRWAPSVGAWQAYRKHYTLQVARQVAGVPDQAPQATAPAAYDQVQDLDATPTERDQVQDLDAPGQVAPQVRELHGRPGTDWSAKLWRDAQGLALQFAAGGGCTEPTQHHASGRDRAAALRAMVAKAADNAAGYDDSDDERDQVQDLDAPAAQSEQVQDLEATPAKCAQVQDLQRTPAPRATQRAGVPELGQRLAHKGGAWEAWFYVNAGRPCMVFYAGRAQKATARHWYANPAKRMASLVRYAQAAEAKHERKAARKAASTQPHGLAKGDVLQSSWGYEQTNIDHYQVIAVIGKRTVEVRKIASEKGTQAGGMAGDCVPVPGQFIGPAMRRQVDSSGAVNVLQAAYGRASKLEPVAVIAGKAIYKPVGWSSYH